MPGLDFKQLPAFGDASKMLESRKHDYATLLKSQHRADAYSIERQILTDSQFTNKMSQLNARYNNNWKGFEAQSGSQLKELERLRTMAGRGEVDPQMAEQAMYKMVLPPEAFAAKYPNVRQTATARPMSAATVRSNTTLMLEFAEGAEDKRGLEWGDPYKKQSSLLDRYSEWRSQIGYEQLDLTHQRQLDQRWDAMMRSEKKFRDWFSDKDKKSVVAEVRSLRAKTAIGRAMQFKVVGPRKDMSPIGSSINQTMVKRQAPAQFQAPTAEELRGQGSQEAYDKGKQLGYWD